MRDITGKIFSIEEFSTFNGPGIRMTVFLKGCPMRCPWCHNPEGQSFETEYMKNPNGCLSCGACERAGRFEDDRLALTRESMLACPKQLVRQSGDNITPEQIAERILKNAPILKASGGGVTFSGGEPLCHLPWIEVCTTYLDGIHVALQTSGYAEEQVFRRALNLCDLILFDLKIIDNAEHYRICGKSNESILQNYSILVTSGKDFITRIPLIPGYTDRVENLSDIAAFMRKNGVSYAELLPYNQLADAKYGSLLRNYTLKKFEDTDKDTVQSVFSSFGIQTKIM